MAQQATLYPTLASAVWPSEKTSDLEAALAARHDRQASLAKVR